MRTVSDGNDNNNYTEGNPSLGVPATVVGANELNNIQNEIALVIEDVGDTLDQTGATQDQLIIAIKKLIQIGGTTADQMSLADNQIAPANVTAIPAFDKSVVKSGRMLVDLFRRNDSKSANEQYVLMVMYDPEGDTWSMSFTSVFDDAGTNFSITSVGQIRYTTDAYAGTGYTGTLRVSHVQTLAI